MQLRWTNLQSSSAMIIPIISSVVKAHMNIIHEYPYIFYALLSSC